MDRTLIKRGITLFLFVALAAGFFAPYLKYGGVLYSAKDVVFSDFSNVYTYLLLMPYLFFFIGAVFLLLKQKIVYTYIIFISFLVSGVLYFFTPYFYALLIGVSEKDVSIGVYTVVIAVVAILACLYSARDIFRGNSFTISDIVEIAMLVSLAIVLDLAIFKFKIVPNGGSISFAMVPLMIIALRKGFVKGFISLGVVYGLLDCLIDGYGIITYPLDYLLGFGLLALIGLFSKFIFNREKKVTVKGCIFILIGVIVGCAGRTLASTLSGVFLYDMSFFESMVYQLTYIGPSAVLVLILMYVLYKPLLIINVKFGKKTQGVTPIKKAEI